MEITRIPSVACTLVSNDLLYRGKVGTGFDDATIKEISKLMKELKEIRKPIANKVLDEKTSKWLETMLMVENQLR